MIDESRLQGWRRPYLVEHQNLLNKASKGYRFFRPDIRLPAIVTVICVIVFLLVLGTSVTGIMPANWIKFSMIYSIMSLICCMLYNINACQFNYLYNLISSEQYVILPCMVVSARRVVRGTKTKRSYYYAKIVTQFDEHCSKEYNVSGETYKRWKSGVQDVCYLVKQTEYSSTHLFTPY